MRRRHVAILLLVGIAVGSASGAQRDVRTISRPNVVLILMDDLGYGDLGSYGVFDAKTPNLDRLAREGLRLTDAYANASNCSPTRAGLITGQYKVGDGGQPLSNFGVDEIQAIIDQGWSGGTIPPGFTPPPAVDSGTS